MSSLGILMIIVSTIKLLIIFQNLDDVWDFYYYFWQFMEAINKFFSQNI